MANAERAGGFPISSGILLGLGVGGFFDGIVFHQLFQWHHMLSSWYPITSVENLKLNTLWDGIFHAATYVIVVAGLFIFWRYSRQRHIIWSSKLLVGALLIGWGIFNAVEGVLDHQVLGIHHVNETVPREQWMFWDIGFLVWAAVMLVSGGVLLRQGKRETARRAAL